MLAISVVQVHQLISFFSCLFAFETNNESKIVIKCLVWVVGREWGLFARHRFRIPSLELKCLGSSFGGAKQKKFSIPRDSTWPPCDKGQLGSITVVTMVTNHFNFFLL